MTRLATRKQQCRQFAKQRRRLAVCPPVHRRLGDRLAGWLRTAPDRTASGAARIIAAYHAIGREIRLDLAHLASYGHLVLPRAMPDTRVLSFFPPVAHDLINDPMNDHMTADDAGVPAPPPMTQTRLIPDIILVPLLAFDSSGRRLGYGKGYYDATLTWLRGRPCGRPITAIGIAAQGQWLETIPSDPWDQSLDGIITERRFWPTPQPGASCP